jgi:hypothetical protein
MDGMQDLHSLGVQVDPFFIDRNGEFDEDAYWNVRSFAGRYSRSRIRLRTFWTNCRIFYTDQRQRRAMLKT